VSLACRAAAFGERYTVPFTGRTGMVHVDDVVDACWAALSRELEGAHGAQDKTGIYLVCARRIELHFEKWNSSATATNWRSWPMSSLIRPAYQICVCNILDRPILIPNTFIGERDSRGHRCAACISSLLQVVSTSGPFVR
jgi:hypothetical protein